MIAETEKDIKKLSVEEIKESIIKNKIYHIDHHKCGICGVMVRYFIIEGNLYFDGSCGCSTSRLQERDWESLLTWYNMQASDEGRKHVANLFGLEY